MSTIFRIILLQSLWYLFIKYGDSAVQIYFPLLALLITGLDKFFFIKDISWKSYTVFTLFLIICGLIIDSSLMWLELIQFAQWSYPFSPPFLWSIWIIFLPYYSIAFEKFKDKHLLAFVGGLIFAPFSYFSGTKIGDLAVNGELGLIAIGIMWGIFFPTSVSIYYRLKHQ